MDAVITEYEAKQRKPKVSDVRSGDTVRVHQKVREGAKERTQVFEGIVIRTRRANSLTSSITVRRLASGVGVEKSYFLHSPTVVKVEVLKRSKVRRNFLSYMRARTGKASRLADQEFDKEAANVAEDAKPKSKDSESKPQDKATLEGEKPSKAELKVEKAAEEKDKNKVTNKADQKEDKPEKPKAEAKDDKAAEKKAKAEEFRKAQAAKK